MLVSYRILDLTNERGLLCGKVLGDMGADVIMIEPPQGHPSRKMGPFFKDIPHPEKSLYWMFTNLNKRGITLDITQSEGREIFKKMVSKADAVIESFDPGYMEGLGLGYADLEKINPGIVLTSITPFGQKGPYAHFKVTDLVGMSMGGMVRIFGNYGEAPVRISMPQFYFLGSLYAMAGAMLALYHRDMSGQGGQHVDASCQQAVAKSLMDASSWWDINKVNIVGTGNFILGKRPSPPGELRVRRVWECKDGHVVFIMGGGANVGMSASSKALVQLANEHGMALEIKDFDWSTWNAAAITQEEADKIINPLADFLKTMPIHELFEEAVKRSILIGPIQNTAGLMESSQLKARQFWTEVPHPELGGTLTYPGYPLKVTGCDYRPQRRAPMLGEHNEEIYLNELGFPREKLVLLKTQGII